MVLDQHFWCTIPYHPQLSPHPPHHVQVRGGLAYLSGHLHTLGGLAPRLYALHRSGTPELELADWKENRAWRLAAIDNGLLSFTDLRHGDWPAVLVTNPKPAAMVAPGVENLRRVLASRAVRVLVFSPLAVTEVAVRVDREDWRACAVAEEGVYTVDWEPAELAGSPHTLTVRVDMLDDFGETSSKEVVQRFVVDEGSLANPEYSLYARWPLLPRILGSWDPGILPRILGFWDPS